MSKLIVIESANFINITLEKEKFESTFKSGRCRTFVSGEVELLASRKRSENIDIVLFIDTPFETLPMRLRSLTDVVIKGT